MARLTGFKRAARNQRTGAPGRARSGRRSIPAGPTIHLGWKPWTELDDGVGRTLEWFQARAAA